MIIFLALHLLLIPRKAEERFLESFFLLHLHLPYWDNRFIEKIFFGTQQIHQTLSISTPDAIASIFMPLSLYTRQSKTVSQAPLFGFIS